MAKLTPKQARERRGRNTIRKLVEGGYRINERKASKFYKMVLDETDPLRLKGQNANNKKK